MKFYALFVITLFFSTLPAQEQWGWDSNRVSTLLHPINKFEETIKDSSIRKSFVGKLIWFYKKKISPRHSRQCPFYPSCSTYTLYSIKKYGFVVGFIMGVERLYLRENRDALRKIHYFTFRYQKRKLAYDPPEANFIFKRKDWRIINPDFYPPSGK